MGRIDTVDEVDPGSLTEDDARRAGVRSLAELRRLMDPGGRARLSDGDLLLPVGYEISHRGRAYLG